MCHLTAISKLVNNMFWPSVYKYFYWPFKRYWVSVIMNKNVKSILPQNWDFSFLRLSSILSGGGFIRNDMTFFVKGGIIGDLPGQIANYSIVTSRDLIVLRLNWSKFHPSGTLQIDGLIIISPIENSILYKKITI